MVPQGTPGGVSSTGYNETFFGKYVLLKNGSLHISENCHLLFEYTPLDTVSMYRQNVFF